MSFIDYFGGFLSPAHPLLGFAIEALIVLAILFWWFRNKKRIKYNIKNKEERRGYLR